MSCPLSEVRIHLFAGSGRNYFLSINNFNCLASFVPFLYVAQGSFVFVLIFSTAFIPSQHCPVTITPKGHDCPHQTKARFWKIPNSVTTPRKSIWCVSDFCSVSQLSKLRAGFIFLLLIGPDDTSVPSELPPHCAAVAVFSTLSFPMKHDPGCYWGCLCAFFSYNPLHLCTGPPSFGPGGNHALYVNRLTPWTSAAKQEKKVFATFELWLSYPLHSKWAITHFHCKQNK